jgi:hypothetical protein
MHSTPAYMHTITECTLHMHVTQDLYDLPPRDKTDHIAETFEHVHSRMFSAIVTVAALLMHRLYPPIPSITAVTTIQAYIHAPVT